MSDHLNLKLERPNRLSEKVSAEAVDALEELAERSDERARLELRNMAAFAAGDFDAFKDRWAEYEDFLSREQNTPRNPGSRFDWDDARDVAIICRDGLLMIVKGLERVFGIGKSKSVVKSDK